MNRKLGVMAAGLLSVSLLSGCLVTPEQQGGLVGAGVGAAVGSTIGHGAGRGAAIVLGALLGSNIGANIGRGMSEQDRVQTAQAMEYGSTGRPYTWRNPDSQYNYTVTPTRTYYQGNAPCREFDMMAYIDGQPQQVRGTACRQPDGTWQVVR